MNITRVAKLNSPEKFGEHLKSLGIKIPFVEAVQASPHCHLSRPIDLDERKIGNRFCILPMEGWDGTPDGKPTKLTRRRWEHFGISGAKLIWGGEAVAVRHDGRANPNQLLLNDQTMRDIESLRKQLQQTHVERFGEDSDLFVGLQLTHSGRFARPNDQKRLEPRTVYLHSILDRKFDVGKDAILTDSELSHLIDDFIGAAKRAAEIGFDFVDIKHCHGYLGHELLSGFDRTGKFGGSFDNRTRFLREIVAGIRAEVPRLEMGVRLSVFDFCPFEPGEEGTGIASCPDEYGYAFGGTSDGRSFDLDEPVKFVELLKDLGIHLVCTTAGSPYYNPHIQRPALFPPSDGYRPPEDPLVGVARQMDATAKLKASFPEMIFVGSAYSYLQDWIPNVAEAVVGNAMADSIGLGRMVLSYPELPADILEGKTTQRKKVCRTFSDCTTAPRNGIVSGCYPLDPFYKKMPEHDRLKEAKSLGDG